MLMQSSLLLDLQITEHTLCHFNLWFMLWADWGPDNPGQVNTFLETVVFAVDLAAVHSNPS